jgi:hypothetical protein
MVLISPLTMPLNATTMKGRTITVTSSLKPLFTMPKLATKRKKMIPISLQSLMNLPGKFEKPGDPPSPHASPHPFKPQSKE